MCGWWALVIYNSLDIPGIDVGHPAPPGPIASLMPSGQQPCCDSSQSDGAMVGVSMKAEL